MTFSLRKNSERGVVGLDIDGRYLAAAQVDSGRVVRGASLELPGGLVRDGEVVDQDGLADALKRFVNEAGLPKSVRLGVANQQIVVRVVELPRIEDPKERDAAVHFMAAEAIAMPLDEAILDYQVAGYAEAMDGTARMQVVLVAARRSMIDALLEAAKKAGLRPEGIDLDAFALVRTLAAASADGDDGTARVFCHLGGVSNLAIAVGTTCFFTRPLSAVWGDDDAGSQLAEEIRLSIDFYMTQPQAKPVGEVVLSGPGSSDSALVESLAERPRHPGGGRGTARPDRFVRPRAGRGSAPLHGGGRPGSGSVRVRPVNLVPQDQRRRTPSDGGGKSAHAALGVLALLLAMVVGYVLTSNTVTERQNETEAARVEADRLEAKAAQKGNFADFASIAQTRMQSVAGVAATRFDWERFMRELARVIPADSWLQSADASTTGEAAAAGTAAAPAPTGAPATGSPTANLTGCTPSQSDAARLMVRLRQLHRVEDVELGSSTKEETALAQPASRAAAGATSLT